MGDVDENNEATFSFLTFDTPRETIYVHVQLLMSFVTESGVDKGSRFISFIFSTTTVYPASGIAEDPLEMDQWTPSMLEGEWWILIVLVAILLIFVVVVIAVSVKRKRKSNNATNPDTAHDVADLSSSDIAVQIETGKEAVGSVESVTAKIPSENETAVAAADGDVAVEVAV